MLPFSLTRLTNLLKGFWLSIEIEWIPFILLDITPCANGLMKPAVSCVRP